VRQILSDEGIEILLDALVLSVRGRSCEGVSLIVRTASGERTIDGSNILVAAGRIPNTADGLENAGVAGRARLCPRQERLETSAPDVWALDECAGSPRPAALASTAPRSAAGRSLPISASSPGLTGRSSNGRRSGHWMPAFLPSPERSSHHPRSDAANAPVERL